MSDAPLVEDPAEISWEASQAIQSWRNVLAKAQGDRGGIFERAAVELFRLTANDPNGRRAIVDILHHMAVAAGIDDDEAQARMARASKAPPDARPGGMNGQKKPQPDPKRLPCCDWNCICGGHSHQISQVARAKAASGFVDRWRNAGSYAARAASKHCR